MGRRAGEGVGGRGRGGYFVGLSYLTSIFHKSGKSEGEVQWEGTVETYL